ncbi:hypothetical protein GCM10027414_37680 [Humibacter ginsengiterrae]
MPLRGAPPTRNLPWRTHGGTRADVLERLGYLGRSLDRLRREQDALLLDRDQLIVRLREVGESWNSLTPRTGLSRQALSKRTIGPNGR